MAGFEEAIKGVKNGKKARRRGWKEKRQYIELGVNVSYYDPAGQLCMAVHEDVGSAAIISHGPSGSHIGGLTSEFDILAEDWEVF